MSLNDDGESNVLEGIRNVELLTNLRETSWRKVGVVLIGLDVIGHGLNLYVHVLMSAFVCSVLEFTHVHVFK